MQYDLGAGEVADVGVGVGAGKPPGDEKNLNVCLELNSYDPVLCYQHASRVFESFKHD